MGLKIARPARTMRSRALALSGSLLAALSAGMVFYSYGTADGFQSIDAVRSLLIFISTWWLAWGAVGGLLGLTTRATPPENRVAGPITGRTAVLFPVYNEDPQISFARIAAMDASLRATGDPALVHFAILSDTRNDVIGLQERRWFARLVRETGGEGRMFYRRRALNTGKKAGNIEDFFVTSGANYDYALILDADSLMEGDTILEMIRRMEAQPDLGLLQTLPRVINARARFGRAMQFAASFYSPVFARGLAMMQGRTGPFWGHNALVRVRAFAESCALPELAGQPPFGGHILSHDYVEAALLARAGWTVRLDDDLTGSYEEGPENIIDHAKRDRRWCQGNLQHSRLLGAPGLKPWSRFVFFQGIFGYVAPLFWLAFILASIAAPHFVGLPNYFPEPYWRFPVFPPDETAKAVGLAVGIFGLLLMPKFLVALDAAVSGRSQGHGGSLRATISMLMEIALSTITAPLFLMFQTRSVLQVLLGRDGGWPANNRGDGRLTLSDAWVASRWITVYGVAGLVLTQALAPALLLWLIPISGPMILAPVIIWWTSQDSQSWIWTVPSELITPPVAAAHQAIMARWSEAPPATSVTLPEPGTAQA